MIENPIIRGFNPDPSIIRVGKDYYIATSTFEWWPGVNIYHSKDLKNWTLHSRPLQEMKLLDMTGVPDGGGVWAPDLSYDGKKIYLVYTNVRERGAMMQTENYLISAENINGGWSEAIYLNSLGFDPSLFHDEDGRKWLISLDNHYGDGQRFNGLYIQEYDDRTKRLIGERRKLYTEPHGELVEGAHIYRFNGMYYLLKAQGGTGERHSAQLSKAKNLFGPWEDMPEILMHTRDDRDYPLQKAGHGDIVETEDGKMYMVHLAARYSSEGHCIFGRETCIQQLEWGKDGWLHLSGGGERPHIYVPALSDTEESAHDASEFYDFKKGIMPGCFQSLRVPMGDRAGFTKNGLKLRGCDGLNSRYEQSLIARRIDSAEAVVTTKLTFEPESEKHLAGLVFIYDTCHWHYVYLTRGSVSGEKEMRVLSCDGKRLIYPSKGIKIKDTEAVELRGSVNGDSLQFSFNAGEGFCLIGGKLDINILSDEHVHLGFTGAMVGICCQDLFRKEKCADFEWMEYRR